MQRGRHAGKQASTQASRRPSPPPPFLTATHLAPLSPPPPPPPPPRGRMAQVPGAWRGRPEPTAGPLLARDISLGPLCAFFRCERTRLRRHMLENRSQGCERWRRRRRRRGGSDISAPHELKLWKEWSDAATDGVAQASNGTSATTVYCHTAGAFGMATVQDTRRLAD